jgi:hypothetical protein
MASILSFRPSHPSQNWTNEELAELFRVVDILGRAGVAIDTDMGLSDEGEPWFAFCRADTGDVIVHFSRIDGQFVAVSATTDTVVRGSNFRRVAETLVNRQPLILPAPSSGQKLFLHPAVILTALVATTLAQMKSWDGQELFALQDASGGAMEKAADASLPETIKSGFMDALHFVLRGFTGSAETRLAPGEHSGPTALGLGLGHLSLASVVAYAISVIQGSSILEDANIAEEEPQTSGDIAAAKPDRAALPPPIAAHDTPSDAGAPVLSATGKELAAEKKAAHDAAAAMVMGRPDTGGKAAAISDDDGIAHIVRHDPPDHGNAREAVMIAMPEKLAQAGITHEAPRAEPARHNIQTEASREDAAAAPKAEAGAIIQLHHFSFTEISREAIEIFFVKIADDPITSNAGFAIDGGQPAILGGGGPLAAEMAPVRTVLSASDIVFAAGDPVALGRLNQITDFVNLTENRFAAPTSFPELLSHYWDGGRPMTVVVFDSDDLPLSIFSFTNNVLFVEESQLAGASLQADNGGLQVDLANGGDVTLLGVINLLPVDMA